MPSSGHIVREYVAIYGCLRALTAAVVAVTVAVGDTGGPSASRFAGGESSLRALHSGRLEDRVESGYVELTSTQPYVIFFAKFMQSIAHVSQKLRQERVINGVLTHTVRCADTEFALSQQPDGFIHVRVFP